MKIKIYKPWLIIEILKTNFVGNVLIVRWDDLNGNHHLNDPHFLLESIFLYAEVVKNTQLVARRLADFLLWIREVGNITPDLLHLIGHSLGLAWKLWILYYGIFIL